MAHFGRSAAHVRDKSPKVKRLIILSLASFGATIAAMVAAHRTLDPLDLAVNHAFVFSCLFMTADR